MKKYLVHIVWVVVAIVAFLGGRYYLPASASTSSATGTFTRGNFSSSTRGVFTRGAGGTGGSGGFAMGQILSEDSQSITLQVASGSSEVVFYSPSTKISKTVSGTTNDLTTGTTVVVAGTPNSDGSLTAQTIQIGGPTGFGGGGGFGARGAGTQSTGSQNANTGQ